MSHVCTYLSPKALAFVRSKKLLISHVRGGHQGIHCLVIKWRGRNHERNGAQRKTTRNWSETAVNTSHIWKQENQKRKSQLIQSIFHRMVFYGIYLLTWITLRIRTQLRQQIKRLGANSRALHEFQRDFPHCPFVMRIYHGLKCIME